IASAASTSRISTSERSREPIGDGDLKAVRDAGYNDANIIEIVALVAMYSLTNFLNNVFDPDRDFPLVAPAGSI
ncbi:hypothetical protein ACC791_37715, partial [Rhizobium ruizarguesonis]